MTQTLKDLFLSDNEEDVKLAFEMAKVANITAKEMDEFDNECREKWSSNFNYIRTPLFTLLREYLDEDDNNEGWFYSKWSN